MEENIPNRYKNIIGTANTVWVTISGVGVIIAEKIKAINIAYLKFFK